MKLKIGLPKGSLQEKTFEMFGKAGYKITIGSRSYFPRADDSEIEIVLLRAQEISKYVEEGIFDCGITGKDWIEENNSKVHEVTEFVYAKSGLGKVRWVIAVPEQSKIHNIKDLEGKRIATEAINITKKFLKQHKVNAKVEFSWGATEAKTPELVDAIVDVTETGSSLKANNLRVVETIMESTTRFIANKQSWKDTWKRRKMENLCMLLQGALNAEKKVGVKMNVRTKDLDKVLNLIPSLRNPTISALTQKGWHAIEIVVDEPIIRDLIPQLKQAGAEGIIEFPLNKVIY